MKVKVSLDNGDGFHQKEIEAKPIKLNNWKRKFAIHPEVLSNEYVGGDVAITDATTGLQVAIEFSRIRVIKKAKIRLSIFTEAEFSKWADECISRAKKNLPLLAYQK